MNKVSEQAPRLSWIIGIYIFGCMAMVDMAILRIRFFENEKCKQFSKMSDFSYLRSQRHPVRASLARNSNPGRSERVRNMFGTRCSEHDPEHGASGTMFYAN